MSFETIDWRSSRISGSDVRLTRTSERDSAAVWRITGTFQRAREYCLQVTICHAKFNYILYTYSLITAISSNYIETFHSAITTYGGRYSD
jgi:hypothetical protein